MGDNGHLSIDLMGFEPGTWTVSSSPVSHLVHVQRLAPGALILMGACHCHCNITQIQSQLVPLSRSQWRGSLMEVAFRLTIALELVPEEQASGPFTGEWEESLFSHVVGLGASHISTAPVL